MQQKTKRLAVCAMMCALLMISTLWLRFSIPGTDVLFTTQTFFVALCGQLLRPSDCLYTLGVYILLGLSGLPVFSAVQGPAVIATPMFGYLLGFLLSAAVTAFVRMRLERRKGARLLSALLGLLLFYLVSLAYIAALFAFYLSKPIGLPALLTGYCLAFLPMDVVKTLLAVGVSDRLSRALR